MPGDPVSLRASRSCGRPWTRTAGLLLVALGLAAAGTARADGRQDARHHYEQATAAFGLGHFLEAADHYQAAFSLRPDPALLYDAAQAYRLGGNKARALELYRNYARIYGDAPNAGDARDHAAALERELSAAAAPADVPVTDAVVAPAPETPPPAPETAPPAPNLILATPAAPPAAPVAVAATSSAATTQDAPSLVHRPWFWIALGAVAAAGVLAVVLATSGDKDPKASIGTIVVGN